MGTIHIDCCCFVHKSWTRAHVFYRQINDHIKKPGADSQRFSPCDAVAERGESYRIVCRQKSVSNRRRFRQSRQVLPVLMLLMLHDSISVGRIVIERVVATGTDRSTACNSSSHAAAPELLPRRNVNDVAVVITDPDRPQRNEL